MLVLIAIEIFGAPGRLEIRQNNYLARFLDNCPSLVHLLSTSCPPLVHPHPTISDLELWAASLFTKPLASSTRPRRFPCNFCDKSFTRKEHANSHVDTVHKKLRPYPCPYNCGRAYGQTSSRSKHAKTCKERLKDDTDKN